MDRKKIRLGIVADLSPKGSIHQQTFLRAIKMSFADLETKEHDVELLWANDRATFEGGQASAVELVAQNVDLVIGHYASSAAKGALPFYQEKGIPVLLPAATADFLTQKTDVAFRLCGKDSDLVELIIATLAAVKVDEIYLGNDGSVHGVAASDDLRIRLAETAIRIIDDPSKTAHLVYAASYTNSIDFVKKLPSNGQKQTIYFMDDAVHKDLAKNIGDVDKNIYVFGYRSSKHYESATNCVNAYFDKWSEYPGTYYLETYAAMQIALAVSLMKKEKLISKLSNHSWETVLGKVDFDEAGESNKKNLAIWHLNKAKLVPTRNNMIY